MQRRSCDALPNNMADSTKNPLSESRTRWLAFAGIAAAFAGVFTALFTRTRQTNKPISQAIIFEGQSPTLTQPAASSTLHAAPDTIASPRRTIAFIVLTIFIAVLLSSFCKLREGM